MIQLAVLADIHGNMPALSAVIDDMRQYTIDHVVVAGDHIIWAPFNAQVIDTLIEKRWSVIRGNHEYYLLDHATPRAPHHWKHYALPPLARAELGAERIRFIESMPDALSLRFRDAQPIRIAHGTPDSAWQPIFPDSSLQEIESFLTNTPEKTIVCAHTHIPMDRFVGDHHIINPGSVGVPLDGQFSASYMILEGDHDGWRVQHYRRVPFDYAPIYEEFERQCFVDKGGVQARLVIEEFRTARLQIHPYYQWAGHFHAGAPHTLELVEEFLANGEWEDDLTAHYHHLDGTCYIQHQ